MATWSVDWSGGRLSFATAGARWEASSPELLAALTEATAREELTLVVSDDGLRALLAGLAAGRVRVEPRPTQERSQPAPQAREPEPVRVSNDAATAQTTPKAAPSLEDLLRNVERYTWWDPFIQARRDEVVAAVLGHPDGTRAAVDERIARGETIRAAMNDIASLCRRFGPDAQRTQQRCAAFLADFGYLEYKVAKDLGYWRSRQAKAAEEREALAEGRSPSAVSPGKFTHALQELPPARSWTVVIDEGGTIEKEGDRAAFVAVAVPEATTLPPLEGGWHAVDQSAKSIDRVVQQLLDAENVGVLGLTRTSLPKNTLDPWVNGVLSLVRWLLRLLPVDEQTTLSVLVEQRGEHVAGSNWKAAFARLHGELAEVEPRRAEKLALEIRLIAKDESPFNGYADAVAYTWVSMAAHARARREQSGLLDQCLLFDDLRPVAAAFDQQMRGEPIAPELWRALIARKDAECSGSPAAAVLARARSDSKADTTHFANYLEATRRHLDGKAVELWRAGREVRWLRDTAPVGEMLPTAFRLALLTADLEAANHRGEIDLQHEAELTRLADQLYDEDPTLVCQAELNRAVLATNRFDFEGASRVLARWLETPPAVAGLRHHARVLSSLGQHRAFLGDHRAAETLLTAAIELFDRLSDPKVAAGEKAQTACYRAIAAMDDRDREQDDVRALVRAVTSLELPDISTLSADHAPPRKYAHHVLARYLVLRGSPEERASYLARRDDWEVPEDGHPWPLILAYRAMLLRPGDPKGAADLLAIAVNEARWADQGPLVWYIGEVLAAIARTWGARVGPAPVEQATKMRRQLMSAPWRTVERLEATRAPAPEILEKTLPFNFH